MSRSETPQAALKLRERQSRNGAHLFDTRGSRLRPILDVHQYVLIIPPASGTHQEISSDRPFILIFIVTNIASCDANPSDTGTKFCALVRNVRSTSSSLSGKCLLSMCDDCASQVREVVSFVMSSYSVHCSLLRGNFDADIANCEHTTHRFASALGIRAPCTPAALERLLALISACSACWPLRFVKPTTRMLILTSCAPTHRHQDYPPRASV